MLTDLAEFNHLVTRLKFVPSAADDASLTEDERRRGAEFAKALSVRVLSRTWQMLLKGIPEVQASNRPVSAAEMVLIRLAHAADLPTLDEALKSLGDGAARLRSPRPPRQPLPPASPATAALARAQSSPEPHAGRQWRRPDDAAGRGRRRSRPDMPTAEPVAEIAPPPAVPVKSLGRHRRTCRHAIATWLFKVLAQALRPAGPRSSPAGSTSA